jgi:hypothetical protein
MSILIVGKPLREKLGDEAVDVLVELINQSQSDQKKDILEFVGEKFERRLSEEIGTLRAELIKWMFIFWIGQVGVILGILFTFFKK